MIPITFFDKYRDKLSANDTKFDDKGSYHIKWMMTEIPKLNDYAKVNRWLGFIQGWFWSNELFTINEMKNDVENLLKQNSEQKPTGSLMEVISPILV